MRQRRFEKYRTYVQFVLRHMLNDKKTMLLFKSLHSIKRKTEKNLQIMFEMIKKEISKRK